MLNPCWANQFINDSGMGFRQIGSPHRRKAFGQKIGNGWAADWNNPREDRKPMN